MPSPALYINFFKFPPRNLVRFPTPSAPNQQVQKNATRGTMR